METVRQTRQMLAMMNPALDAEEYVFCATTDAALADAARGASLGWFNEREGASPILERGVAAPLGFAADLPMRRVELSVNSALDGVGLTAAVSGGLAVEAIPGNVVAAFCHDCLFVPSGMAERALAALRALQARAIADPPAAPDESG